MNKKLNQAQPEGRAQPEIMVCSRWKDGWGAKVTVIEFDGYRVLFLRDGYAHPCRMTDHRFTREFRYLPDESPRSEELMEKTTLPLSVGSDGFDKEFR